MVYLQDVANLRSDSTQNVAARSAVHTLLESHDDQRSILWYLSDDLQSQLCALDDSHVHDDVTTDHVHL